VAVTDDASGKLKDMILAKASRGERIAQGRIRRLCVGDR